MSWFKEIYGFKEAGSFQKTRDHFQIEGEWLLCPTATHPRQFIGQFDTPMVSELRQLRDSLLACTDVTAPEESKREVEITFQHQPDPVGVGSMIADPRNMNCVFQAASQFNCLEMTGPGTSPRQGVTGYINDPTQGPKCALACPAALIYRNYLCLEDNQGQGVHQIDCLKEVGKRLGNHREVLWEMRNGYALPVNSQSLRVVHDKILGNAEEALLAQDSLRVGVHWSTSVKPPKEHRVCQVFASALPVSYAKYKKTSDWEPWAILVLKAAYEATLLVAACIAAKERRRVTVYLTKLGGGAFGNQAAWIIEAISFALEQCKNSPLDVVLIHYGTQVESVYRNNVHSPFA